MGTITSILTIILSCSFIFFLLDLFFGNQNVNTTKRNKMNKEKYYNLFIDKINNYLCEINNLKQSINNSDVKNDINESIFFLRMIALEMDSDIIVLSYFKDLESFHLSYYTNILKNYCINQESDNVKEMEKIGKVIHRYKDVFNNFSKELSGEKALKELDILKKYF